MMSAETTVPYLSIVVTARNDNHGGDMLDRIQAFVSSLARQCKEFNLDAELIVVEWNPPADKKRIYDEIIWPTPVAPLVVRFIEVPPVIHNSLEHADKFPLFQMIAKNVGIRRARGQYVLATNIDIIFSDELIWLLAQRLLREDSFYRVDRYDVGQKLIPKDILPQNLIEYCRDNIIRINAIDGTFDKNSPEFRHHGVSLEHGNDELLISDSHLLHTNACGDFTLMSQKCWHQLKGYPEIQKWSIFIDGLIVHMAFATGLKQIVLPDPIRIYHIEHDLGWAVTQETTKTRPSLDYENEYLPWCEQMLRTMTLLTPNDDNWGFAENGFSTKHVR